ncbi:sulfatase-like hydrolase/transferase [Oscillospiraceae bacterium NSJ-54]|uniref:Sulfatase-like hydrolase/transferase n=1 Tax=Zongyangia hominis TaxID=2763677 RepID=A0A926IBD2_9FIRM|nr:sulfatase-like hydrolase/transferase [Zongyangia hominis]
MLEKLEQKRFSIGGHDFSLLFVLRLLMVGFFPLFLAFTTELNHIQNLGQVFTFMGRNPQIILLDYLIVAVIFLLTSLLFKRTCISMGLTGLIFFIVSWVEYFKFDVSGTHFTITDLQMTSNATDIAKFANIHLTWYLVLNFLLLAAYVAAAYFFKLENKVRLKYRMLSFCATFAVVCIFFVTPTMAMDVFELFRVEEPDTANVFMADKHFQETNLITYFTQSAAEYLSTRVARPQNYNEETVDSMLIQGSQKTGGSVKPNVIMIMSESFADFRQLEKLDVDPTIYQNFDKAKKEGFGGTCVVPTFGGYTVRTEFELLTGMPVKSLHTPPAPQKMLKDKDSNASVASYYRQYGYKSYYIHPFSSSFYGRKSIYSTFGFDKMYFEDDLTVERTRFGSNQYIDDQTLFHQITSLLSQNDEPSLIFTTTMQNHQPYTGNGVGDAELGQYLRGIRETDRALGEFLEGLKQLNEPTLVFFVGDHFPMFTHTNTTYDDAGIDYSNSTEIYKQSYFIWSNYGADLSGLPTEEVSTFYLPYLLIDVAGIPQTELASTMLAHRKEVPVYSPTSVQNVKSDEFLDMLTYDRVFGQDFCSDAG